MPPEASCRVDAPSLKSPSLGDSVSASLQGRAAPVRSVTIRESPAGSSSRATMRRRSVGGTQDGCEMMARSGRDHGAGAADLQSDSMVFVPSRRPARTPAGEHQTDSIAEIWPIRTLGGVRRGPLSLLAPPGRARSVHAPGSCRRESVTAAIWADHVSCPASAMGR